MDEKLGALVARDLAPTLYRVTLRVERLRDTLVTSPTDCPSAVVRNYVLIS